MSCVTYVWHQIIAHLYKGNALDYYRRSWVEEEMDAKTKDPFYKVTLLDSPNIKEIKLIKDNNWEMKFNDTAYADAFDLRTISFDDPPDGAPRAVFITPRNIISEKVMGATLYK